MQNAWRLFNAFTTALMPRAKTNPQQHAALTMRLGALLENGNGRHVLDCPAPGPNGSTARADDAGERPAAAG